MAGVDADRADGDALAVSPDARDTAVAADRVAQGETPFPDAPSDLAPDLVPDLPPASDAARSSDGPLANEVSVTADTAALDTRPTGPTTYYVAPNGSDQADGSLSAPFKTIQRCAALARPGDKCLVRAGTYRETVLPKRSGTADAHISFEAYQGECVTVNGADELKVEWTKYQGSIYVAETPLRFIQLFANGKMLNEARWPNADPDDLVHAPWAQAGAATETSLEGPTLPAGDWTGAYLYTIPGARWTSYTRRIETYDPGKRLATWTSPVREPTPLPAIAPRARDTYYVFGSLLALDSAGEWFQDPTTGRIYLWAPGSVDPSTLKIEVKQRDYGFNLGARSYVDLKGFRLFATSVNMAGAAHCTVDGVHARYITHLRETNGYMTGQEPTTWAPTGSGLVVNVDNPGKSQLRVTIQSTSDGSGAAWCAPITDFGKPVFIAWEQFNTRCWDNSGAAYAREPLATAGISIPGALTDIPFDFCVNGMAPRIAPDDGELESPAWVVQGGQVVVGAAWQGYLWAGASSDSNITLANLSAVAASPSLCASGTLKKTADYSSWASVSFGINRKQKSSAAPELGGPGNEWKNGSIAFAATEGIVASGSNGRISNNVVHDVGYMAAGSLGGVAIGYGPVPPAGNEIADNTLFRTGTFGILNSRDATARILRNRVSQAMLRTDDGGLIYSWGTPAISAEIAYNDLSDIACQLGTGVYLDDGSTGYIVHHNLVRNISYTGISLKMPNRFFNNTILNTRLGAGSIYKNDNTTWVDLSSAVFSNNLIEQRVALNFYVEQKQTTDGCDYQTPIAATSTDWQKVTLPFASLIQPSSWGIRQSFDLTNLTSLKWSIATEGAFDVTIDDVWLEGPTPKLLDDFDNGSTNTLGGEWWGGIGVGTGATATASVSTGFTGNGFRLTGTNICEGWAALVAHLAPDNTSPVDLSSYTGVSFRFRGTATLTLSNGTASTTPLQQHNLECPVDAKGVPTTSCPVDQGSLFPPFTDGYAGAAPDVGAFESGKAPWTAGTSTTEPTTLCPE